MSMRFGFLRSGWCCYRRSTCFCVEGARDDPEFPLEVCGAEEYWLFRGALGDCVVTARYCIFVRSVRERRSLGGFHFFLLHAASIPRRVASRDFSPFFWSERERRAEARLVVSSFSGFQSLFVSLSFAIERERAPESHSAGSVCHLRRRRPLCAVKKASAI